MISSIFTRKENIMETTSIIMIINTVIKKTIIINTVYEKVCTYFSIIYLLK